MNTVKLIEDDKKNYITLAHDSQINTITAKFIEDDNKLDHFGPQLPINI